MSKSSIRAEALGSLDEVNSFLGLCKVKAEESTFSIGGRPFDEVVHWVQSNLFIAQAELAGADKKIGEEKVTELERLINGAEEELPPIKSFFIAGGTELATLFDIARTQARRAERRVVAVHEGKEPEVSVHTLAFLNRLSSLLYALARLSNHKSGIVEKSPDYQ
jgi:cob(I)alamin adenosyltransferase